MDRIVFSIVQRYFIKLILPMDGTDSLTAIIGQFVYYSRHFIKKFSTKSF